MTDRVLHIENISYSYGSTDALTNVGFSVEPHAFTALLGPNGAGKSTLFGLITGLLKTPQGSITIAGANISTDPQQALAQLGVVFQQPTLDLDLSVVQNLRYFAALRGLSKKITEERIERELNRQDMFQRKDEKVRALNGGHRRRTEIARALLHEPKLIVLDEPTVGLDAPSRRAIVDHVHSLARDGDVGVLWATHLIDEIDPTSDHVVVLHQGTVRADAMVSDALAQHGQDTIQALFQSLTGKQEDAS